MWMDFNESASEMFVFTPRVVMDSSYIADVEKPDISKILITD